MARAATRERPLRFSRAALFANHVTGYDAASRPKTARRSKRVDVPLSIVAADWARRRQADHSLSVPEGATSAWAAGGRMLAAATVTLDGGAEDGDGGDDPSAREDVLRRIGLIIAEYKVLGDSYRKARVLDYDRFSEQDYIRIIEVVNFATSEARMRRSSDLHGALGEGAEAVEALRKSTARFQNSALLNLTDEILRAVRSVIGKKDGPRKKKAGRRRVSGGFDLEEGHIQKVINGLILRAFAKSLPLTRRLADISVILETDREKMNAVNAATILFELGRALEGEVYDPAPEVVSPILSELAEIFARDPEPLEEQTAANALYGLRNLSAAAVPERLPDVLLEGIRSARFAFKPIAIASGLLGIRPHVETRSGRKIVALLFEGTERLEGVHLNAAELTSLVQVHRIYARELPSWLETAYRTFLEHKDERVSADGQRAMAILRERLPGEEVLGNHYVDGFELAVYVPGRRLNVEFAGREHANSRRSASRRDEHLRETHGIRTVRVRLTGGEGQLEMALREIEL